MAIETLVLLATTSMAMAIIRMAEKAQKGGGAGGQQDRRLADKGTPKLGAKRGRS